MESNENSNQSVPATYLEISDVKREPNEDSSGEAENVNQTIYLNMQKLHRMSGMTENSSNENSMSGVKRKNSEENSLNIQEEDRMSDVTNSSNVVVKRRRYSDSQCDESVTNSNDILNANSVQCKEEKRVHTLFVTNSPGEWTSQQIIDYIREECGINISKINDSREGTSETEFQIKLKFPNKEQLERVHKKLKEREAEGKLKVHTDDDNVEGENDLASDNMAQIDEREQITENATPMQEPEQIELAPEENGFYIREDYLNSLGIKMPITNYVTVTNFRCDKSELKEVLELAGRVLVCSVISISNKYANVMYSHPLEAVQAISMLNGQKFYGQTLKLTMNHSKDTNNLLPKGLADIGPGLGKYGKGLPDLVDQYKRFVKGQRSSIDAHLFRPELLRKIGIDVGYDCPTPVVPTASNSSSNHNDNSSEAGSDAHAEVITIRTNANRYNALGQMMNENNLATVTLTSVELQNNRIILNQLGPNIIRQATNGILMPNQPRPQISPMIQSTMIGPRPQTPSNPGLRPQSATNSIPGYPNCPPIPGVDTSNTVRRSYNISVIGSSPMPIIGGPVLTRPMASPMPNSMGPMGHMMAHMATNRFPGPGPRSVGPVIGPRGPTPVQNPNIPVSSPMRPNGPVIGPRGPAPGQNPNIPVSSPMRPNGPVIGPRGPVQNPNIPVSSPMRPNGPITLRPFLPQPTSSSGVQMFKGADPATIQISNLPPSTNFVNLSQKLSEFGHVLFLEFTTPGCAIVRFASPSDADRCLQNYRNVLG